MPPSGRYGECGRARRFARAVSPRCGVDLDVLICRCRRAGVHLRRWRTV